MSFSTSLPSNFTFVTLHENQSRTNITQCLQESTPDWSYTVLQVYILTISVLGIVFNVFVLVVFLFHKKPCTVAEIYLSNLAVADLVLVSFLPFWAVSTSNYFHWPFGGAMCKVVNVSIIMNVYCSIYFLVLVSADRYLALVKPLSNNRLRTAKCAKLCCLLVWGMGLLLSVPTIYYRKTQAKQRSLHNNSNITMCMLDYKEEVMVLLEVFQTLFSFIIPVSFISYFTWNIIQALNKRITKASNTLKMEHKATTLMLVVLLAFLICWVPFHLVRIMEVLYRVEVLKGCRLSAVIGISRQIFMNLAYFNSVLNPILYVIVGKNFRLKATELYKPSTSSMSSRTGVQSFSSKCTYLLRSVRTL